VKLAIAAIVYYTVVNHSFKFLEELRVVHIKIDAVPFAEFEASQSEDGLGLNVYDVVEARADREKSFVF
jgi:hypothetical protein